jgi:hypothetical protein
MIDRDQMTRTITHKAGSYTVGKDKQNEVCGFAPTYQEMLDEALDQTFPASDPISPGAAAYAGERAHHTQNQADWHLQPGSRRIPSKPA